MLKELNQQNATLLLQRYQAVADSIVLLFPGYVEVVIHDLSSQSIVYIANNFSKRKVGDPSALDDVNFEQSETVIGPYNKLNWDGSKLHSSSAILRNDHNTPIGMLCINMNLAPINAIQSALDALMPANNLIPQPEKLFNDDWQERINTFANHWLQQRNLTIATLGRKDKRKLVEALYYEGAFNGKSTADYIANVLGMGRATVFNYLRQIKSQPKKES